MTGLSILFQDYFTSTGTVTWLPGASEATLKNKGK